jgi:hypothetical protein
MNSKTLLLPVIAIVLAIASCSKKPDIENTSTVKMAGEWFVKYYFDGDELTDFNKILSFNTSDPNSNQVWVDDLGLWPFKAKFDIDYANLAFKPMASTPNTEVAGETVKVIEGKIIPGVGHSKSGNIVDSIYLKLEFSDDPGNMYEIRGHGRTGFFEDEY